MNPLIDMPLNIPILFSYERVSWKDQILGIIISKKDHDRNDPCLILKLIATNDNWDEWVLTHSGGGIHYSKSWEIVPIQELPLYINWPYVWPLLAQMILEA